MTPVLQTIQLQDTYAEVFTFNNGTEVREFHVMLHAMPDNAPTFSQQLHALLATYKHLCREYFPEARAVFKRYFLSDAANQAQQVYAEDPSVCALSVIQQPPLDGTKVALWTYMQTGVQTQDSAGGLYAVRHGEFFHLWGGSAHALAHDSESQTTLLFKQYIGQLAQEGCTLANHCIRTWFFVNDIDNNYAGVVKARNNIFSAQGLTEKTHFIASTGIGGRQADHRVLSQLDTYAVAGLHPTQIHYLYAANHLNRTCEYGVSFERGTCIDYGDRRHVFISGTASIDDQGAIVHPGDIVLQTQRMLENVEALLTEAACTFNHIGQMIVYLRDPADYNVVRQIFAERFPNKPIVFLLAPVCRPGWLIEMECMGVKQQENEAFPNY